MKKILKLSFIVLQIILPKHLLSRLVAKLGDTRLVWIKNSLINLAIDAFNINMEEAISDNPDDYDNFNDFFMRELKTGARVVDKNAKTITSPCDGVVSECGKIENNLLIQAKGKYFALKDLLGGDEELANVFINGNFATIYLSPKDYHRVHMPCSGTLAKSIYVPGELFSVNPTTVENIQKLFARNERLVNIFDTDSGPMASIMVGAMLVAGIETVWGGQVVPPLNAITTFNASEKNKLDLGKGDEMGRFKFGSTVILLFPENAMQWNENMQAGQSLKMGEAIANYQS